MDGLGPNGETIMDYSIYDAINAGFGKLVFVIRKDFEQDFRDKIISKYEGHIPCELVFQSIDDLPEGFTCPEGRTKPWGTNHAVMMGADVIKEPFAVINCDDFYGRDSFQVMGKFLAALPEGSKNVYSMVGFRIGNTLSESGTVSRGLCGTDANNLLTSVVERTKIQRMDGEVKYIDDNGEWTATPETTPVITTINSFQCFALIQLLTSGGPNHSTDTIMYYIYYTAFKLYRYGYGNAMGVVLAVIIAILSAVQFKFGSQDN